MLGITPREQALYQSHSRQEVVILVLRRIHEKNKSISASNSILWL